MLTFADWVATGLLGGGFLTAVIVLVRIAIAAERRRADDWRTAALTHSARGELDSVNIAKLISSVEQLSASSREQLALLHMLTAESDRRPAA